MDATQFQALDRAVEAGDVELAGKALADGKAGKKAIEELVAAGHLEARKKKYALTASGRTAWEQHAPAERRAAIAEREEGKREAVVVEFLRLVEQKENKSLTAKDLKKFNAEFVSDAVVRNLIANSKDRDNAYRLTAAGRGRLLSDAPLETQIERIRRAYQETQVDWSAAQSAIERGLKGLPGGAASEVVASLQQRVAAAAAAYDAVVSELQLTSNLSQAAAELQAAGRAARQEADQRLTQAADREALVLGAVRDVEAQMTEFRQEFGPVVAKLPRAAAPSAVPIAADETAWKATRAAYTELREKTLRLGGIVKIPELSDAVLAAVPELTPASFRTLLSKWHDEGRLVLQVCNDRDLEPRAAEGIESSRGHLFYVQLSTV